MLGQGFIFPTQPLGASLQRGTQRQDVPENGVCAHRVTVRRTRKTKLNVLTRKDITDQIKFFIRLINRLSPAKILEN